MENEDEKDNNLSNFTRFDEFCALQNRILALDLETEPSPSEEKEERQPYYRLLGILMEYQEQAYLLDPYLERMVTPVVEKFKAHARKVAEGHVQYSAVRVGILGSIFHGYIKYRGYKAILRFFPHEVADLHVALAYMSETRSHIQDAAQWPARYITLLWLSLVCMLPFDLEQFDDVPGSNATAMSIERVAKAHLGRSGLEREGAALLLSRFYTRRDMISRLPDFLAWSIEEMKNPDAALFTAFGILQVLCGIVKFCTLDLLRPYIDDMQNIAYSVPNSPALSANSLVRKFSIKLTSRLATRLLPVEPILVRRKARSLAAVTELTPSKSEEVIDFDVPSGVEDAIQAHLEALQDKDTSVRWSAAKGIALIAERLPQELSEQIVDSVLDLYSVHCPEGTGQSDIPPIAEATWHGATLASAEITRRGLLVPSVLPTFTTWIKRALFFDVRRGANSIGSNVRDAAAYVLWSIARAQDHEHLQPYIEGLAQCLVTVALFDREVHVRRAASAAFQENVGRTNMFPHGIDVLAKADFYAVSMRRNAFLVAAPQVAVHEVYRSYFFEHLVSVTLKHWDPAMRQLGAEAMSKICEEHDLLGLAPVAINRVSPLLLSVDTAEIHGGLVALSELASALCKSQTEEPASRLRKKIFALLASVPFETVVSPRNGLVSAAACRLISSSISREEIEATDMADAPQWSKIIEDSIASRQPLVQEAGADALAAVSRLADLTGKNYKSGLPAKQQSLAHLLGLLDYDSYPHALPEVVDCLLDGVTSSSSSYFNDVEARRNSFQSLTSIISTVVRKLPEAFSVATFQKILSAFARGLEDYSVTERGDVGSWIRVACVNGLTTIFKLLFDHAASIPRFEDYLPPDAYHDAIGTILKQGVERLDNVRQQSGSCFLSLLSHPLPVVTDNDRWRVRKEDLLKSLFLSGEEGNDWNDGEWLFPKAVQLLDIERYRRPVLHGIILSIGSRTGSTQRPVAASLLRYAETLPVVGLPPVYNLHGLLTDTLKFAREHATQNALVVPAIQTVNLLFEDDCLVKLSAHPEGVQSLQELLKFVTRGMDRFKNIQRIIEAMKIVVNVLAVPHVREDAIPALELLLQHKFPKVRSDTSEFAYMALQTKDLATTHTDEIEEILLETEWSTNELKTLADPTHRLVSLLKT